jgi:hypothetical protein
VDPHQAPDVVKIRSWKWLGVVYLFPAVFCLGLFFASGSNDGFLLAQGEVWLVGAVLFGWAQSWFGIDLTPTEVVVNSLRRRRLPWPDVQAVTQEPHLGGRRVVLWTVAGECVPLRAPVVDMLGFGSRNFEQKFHLIGQNWVRYH